MSKNYLKQDKPFNLPAENGQKAKEYHGRASTGNSGYSVSHIVVPPGWVDAPQRPDFDEITIMVRGKKKAVVDGEIVNIKAGESLLVKKGARVQYSNPYDEPSEYWSICFPAFSFQMVNSER